MRPEPIIWFAIVFSTVIYAVMAYLTVGARTHGSFDDHVRSPYTIVLYVLALAAFVAATALSVALRDRPQRVRMIISLAIYESCAIFGLIAAFLVIDWRLYLAPWALALLGFSRLYPAGQPS